MTAGQPVLDERARRADRGAVDEGEVGARRGRRPAPPRTAPPSPPLRALRRAWSRRCCSRARARPAFATRRTSTPATGGGSSVRTIDVRCCSRPGTSDGTKPWATSRSTRSTGVAELPTRQIACVCSCRAISSRTSWIVSGTSSGSSRKRQTSVVVGDGPNSRQYRSVSTRVRPLRGSISPQAGGSSANRRRSSSTTRV